MSCCLLPNIFVMFVIKDKKNRMTSLLVETETKELYKIRHTTWTFGIQFKDEKQHIVMLTIYQKHTSMEDDSMLDEVVN